MVAAMVLCAGLGTRLRPLTDELAKPMVPVGDAPALAHVAQRVRLAAPRVVVNVHHRPGDVRAWADRESIAVSVEQELLGTAGGVARAAAMLGDGDVLVWNGDILSDLDPRALVAAHAARATEATLAVRARAAGEGNVGFMYDGRVARLRSESFGPETTGGDFLGIHVVGARLRASLPATGCLVGDVYLPALRRGARLDAWVTEASFTDIGTVAQYVEANRAWLRSRDLPSWSSPTAIVRADIDGSIVGAGARIEATCLRSIVWPGAIVSAPVNDAIVTTRAVVSGR
ncbi:MAG: NTP transferase domain-containing protein [Labilithrix sp.]|nr:NTP transferase domain-containing protein [Labilithrix sp.]